MAARALPRGTVITRADVALLRTEGGEGMDASSLDAVLDRQLRCSLDRHALVRPVDLVQS